jgi:hypothetical protein
MKKVFGLSLLFSVLFIACGNRQQLKSFNNVITGDDSIAIELGNSDTIHYHSEALGLDISYPSYLRHQYLDDDQMEVFMTDDVSLSFMVQYLDRGDDIFRTPGQQLMGMGAELIEATDDYSIHQGTEGDLEYYGKVIDDSARFITVILRYNPDHAEGVEPLKELVRTYMP